MFFIRHTTCISPQATFGEKDMNTLREPVDNKLKAIEPAYDAIPPSQLRRMGTAIRLGIGAALPLLKNNTADGIIIGTAKGGMEDSIKFLNQIVQYEEGVLAPGNFVQSTTNAIAGQLGMLTHNKGYNITHTQRGLAFETALIDAEMRLNEFPSHTYLLGGVDEISSFNHNLERLDGAYKTEEVNSSNFYSLDTPGSIAGEGAAMFLVNKDPNGALAQLKGFGTQPHDHIDQLRGSLKSFLQQQLSPGEQIDLLITGENGDNRCLPYYEAVEQLLPGETAIARFKHMTGEYPTASAVALWLAVQLLNDQQLPAHMIKRPGGSSYRNILIYNNFKGKQHGWMLVSLPL